MNTITLNDISIDTMVTKSEDIFIGEIDNEMVTMDIQNGKYYHFNKTGAHILKLLTHPHTVKELCVKMQGKYNVDKDVCNNDIIAFIQELMQLGLIKVVL